MQGNHSVVTTLVSLYYRCKVCTMILGSCVQWYAMYVVTLTYIAPLSERRKIIQMCHLHTKEVMSSFWYVIVYVLVNFFCIKSYCILLVPANYQTRHSQAFHCPLFDCLQYVNKNWTVGKHGQEECTTVVWDPHLFKDLKDVVIGVGTKAAKI